MYAVFRTGGKQFRAEPGKKIRVPSLDIEPGESITFEDVLLTSDGSEVQVGAPILDGAKVKAYVFFKGRSILFKEQGEILLLRFAQELEELGKVEHMPKLEGKRMIMFISPKKK